MSTSDGGMAFEPPGDGPWELDDSHFDRPFPRYGVELFVEGFERGQAESFERVGVPAKGMRVGLVHGLPYIQMVPLLGKASDAYRKPPPAWLFKLVAWLHPGMRARGRTMRRWYETKGWREDLRVWDEELKPGLLARYDALEDVDPAALSDEALVAHLAECRRTFVDSLLAHFHTNPTTIFPVGLFLHRATEWTGCSDLEALALFDDAKVGAREGAPLEAWVRAARDDAAARRVLGDPSITPAETLQRLREREDAVGEATRAWLRTVEHRQVSAGDVSNPIGIEVPGVLVAQLAQALEPAKRADRAVDESAFWARVPDARRAELEALLEEARLVYRLRDERSGLLDARIGGLLRRAVLEAGDRLVHAARLHAREDVIDVATDELPALLLRGDGPSADEVAARGERRRAVRIDEAPRLLGADRPPPPPPLELLDGPMADLFAAIMTYRRIMEDSAPEPDAPAPAALEGLPASGGRYTGTARICTEPAHFASVQPGDVLVARATMPAYNVLLPIVGAVVTDRGGALCHAAIVSREYGLPCVVGTREATARIHSGDIVTVDGDAGRVELASARAVERAS